MTNNHPEVPAAFNSGFMQTNQCHVESKHSAEHSGYETQALILRNTIMVAQFLANSVVFVRNFARNLTDASSHSSIEAVESGLTYTESANLGLSTVTINTAASRHHTTGRSYLWGSSRNLAHQSMNLLPAVY